jgi:hypothetical protein
VGEPLSRRSRLFRIRRNLAEFLLLASCRRKERLVVVASIFIGVYFIGAALMFNTVRRSLNAIPATA